MKVEVTRTLKRVVKLKYENGILKVLANCFLSDKRLRQIIQENIDWVKRQKSDAALKQAEPAPPVKREENPVQSTTTQAEEFSCGRAYRDLFEGCKTVVHGEVVKVVCGTGNKSYLENDVLYLAESYSDTREDRLKGIRAFLKKTALNYVSEEVANFGSNASLCPSKIEFRATGDFWVKCSQAAQRVLCFDYRIVQLPQTLRNYVIAHAFAHFKHPLHDDGFWNFVSNVVPRYKEYAKELEQYRILRDI